jgi:hypothetical protein
MNSRIKTVLAALVIVMSVWACVPSGSSSSSASLSYSEDLSKYRPEITESSVSDAKKSSFQNNDEPFDPPSNDITVALDRKLDTLAKNNSVIKYVNGFTIQVYLGSSSQEAYQARDTAQVILPEIRAEVTYQQPTYKTRVGRFTERIEVQKTLIKLKTKFPNAISVPAKVYIN